MKLRFQQKGLGAIMVLVILVILTVLAAALVRLSSNQSSSLANDVAMSRALQSARSGIQYGFYQALKGSWSSCAGATQTLDLKTTTGMLVTVTCNSTSYQEGESSPGVSQAVRVYEIEAVACNTAGTSCPDSTAATQPFYVERKLQAMAKN